MRIVFTKFSFVFLGVIFCSLLLNGTASANEFSTEAVPIDSGMPYYPGTNIVSRPGDVLYSSKGPDTYLVGHVGIVDNSGNVIHMIGNGMKKYSMATYASNFNFSVYNPSSTVGYKAANYAQSLYSSYSSIATYTLATTLTGPKDKQYCTKLVWQAYYYRAGINLGGISLTKLSVPPNWILDTSYLTFRVSGI